MNNILNVSDKCTGCGLCSFVCPKQCIKLVERDTDHFKYPQIDISKCINCGLCLKSCPTLKEFKTMKNDAFSYQLQPDNDLFKSSSGGAFQTIAKYFLKNNGIVYGAAWDNDLKVNHIRINDVVDLDKILKSKYIQSAVSDEIYSQIKNDVNDGLSVLFCGTPCQCAAVANIFSIKPTNLYLIDIICRGISNQWVFDQSVKAVEKFMNCKIRNFDFRFNQSLDTNNKIFKFDFDKNGKSKRCYGEFDYFPYYKLFQSGKGYRESCYNCQFRSKNRASDITLGDFWGHKEKSFHKSLVIANTYNGLDLVSKIFDKLETTDYDSTIKLNKGYYANPSSRSILDIEKFSNISILINEFKKNKMIKNRIKFKNFFKRIINIFKRNKYEIGFTYKVMSIK